MATKKKANTVDEVVEADKEDIPQSNEKAKKFDNLSQEKI